MQIKYRAFILSSMCFSSWCIAQQTVRFSESAEQIFQSGLFRFEQKFFSEAAGSFQQVIREHPTSQRITASYIMGARALITAKRPLDAIVLLQPIFIRFPRSSYISDACYLLGQAYLDSRNPREALRSLAIGFISTDTDSLRQMFKDLIETKVVHQLSSFDIDDICDDVREKYAVAVIRFAYAQRLYKEAKRDSAELQLHKISAVAMGVEQRSFQEKLKRERGNFSTPLQIWFISPARSGDVLKNKIVEDVFLGIKAGVASHNAKQKLKIDLQQFEYNGNADSLNSFLRSIEHDGDVVAVIGGVFSAESIEIASAVHAIRIPVICPTATASALNDIGEYVFQLNGDFIIRGRAMAQYASEQLNAKHAAVLAPIDTYGKKFAEAFVDAAKEYGITIDVLSWYRAGGRSLSSQFYTMKQNLSYPDSVDVLYLPVANGMDIQTLIHEYTSSGIKSKLLGSGDWNDIELLNSISTTLRSIDFESDFFPDEKSRAWNEFRTAYHEVTSTPYSKHSIFGYDAAKLLVTTIAQGRITRDAIRERLANLSGYDAVRSPISLSHDRMNRSLHILRYENHSIRKVNHILVGDISDGRK